MSCLPGMPCYNSPVVKIVYPPGCDPTPVPVVSSDQVHYDGPNLPCTGVQNGDCLNVVLEKIDNKICSEELVASIIQTIENNDVLKAYFCQLVSECIVVPTTTSTSTATPSTTTTTSSSTSSTTTTTTTAAPVFELFVATGPDQASACAGFPATAIYSLSTSVDGQIVYTNNTLVTPAANINFAYSGEYFTTDETGLATFVATCA